MVLKSILLSAPGSAGTPEVIVKFAGSGADDYYSCYCLLTLTFFKIFPDYV